VTISLLTSPTGVPDGSRTRLCVREPRPNLAFVLRSLEELVSVEIYDGRWAVPKDQRPKVLMRGADGGALRCHPVDLNAPRISSAVLRSSPSTGVRL
jgi:hypothetical protein